MGAACCKQHGCGTESNAPENVLEAMFERIDRDKKGYISLEDLQSLMKDDKTYFFGKDTTHIMNKYGSDSRMTFDQFETWWSSTYTTHNDSELRDMVDKATSEMAQANNNQNGSPHQPMLGKIDELPELQPDDLVVARS
jgi:hypothetical protein